MQPDYTHRGNQPPQITPEPGARQELMDMDSWKSHVWELLLTQSRRAMPLVNVPAFNDHTLWFDMGAHVLCVEMPLDLYGPDAFAVLAKLNDSQVSIVGVQERIRRFRYYRFGIIGRMVADGGLDACIQRELPAMEDLVQVDWSGDVVREELQHMPE